MGFALLFHAVLRDALREGYLQTVIDAVNGHPLGKGRLLIAHLIYLFSALTYFVGLLARKAGMREETGYYVFVCGRGGRFLEWIQGYDQLISCMLSAGLRGPAPCDRDIKVYTRLSAFPKEEVGRGILAESALHAKKEKKPGCYDLLPPTVTAGECGFQGIGWDTELSPELIRGLPPNVPPVASLVELQAFLKAFRSCAATKVAGELLQLDASTPLFSDALKERLFGLGRNRVRYELETNAQAILEPLFIVEAKVLLETCTGNGDLFR